MAFKTKGGRAIKTYKRGTGTPGFPGSWGGYVYERAAPSDYAKTSQQQKIGKCARDNVKKGMSGMAIHEAIRKCWGR